MLHKSTLLAGVFLKYQIIRQIRDYLSDQWVEATWPMWPVAWPAYIRKNIERNPEGGPVS